MSLSWKTLLLDFTKDGPLLAVMKVATPKAARRLGEARFARWLKVRSVRKANNLAQRIVEAAKAQHHKLPAAELKTELIAEIACELRRTKKHITDLDGRHGLLAPTQVGMARGQHGGLSADLLQRLLLFERAKLSDVLAIRRELEGPLRDFRLAVSGYARSWCVGPTLKGQT